MENVELITREVAYQRYLEIKDVAISIAQSYSTTPAYCDAVECQQFVAYASLSTGLKAGEVCLFIAGVPAQQITDFRVAGGNAIGNICASNLTLAEIVDEKLYLHYEDNVIECFAFNQEYGAWQFDSRNIAINVPVLQKN